MGTTDTGVVLGAVLTLGLLATVLLLQSPAPTQTVDELMASPDQHLDQEVALRGEVRDGTIDNTTMTFVLEGATSSITVRFTEAMVSNGLDDNRTVYAEGTLLYEDGVYIFEAERHQDIVPVKVRRRGRSRRMSSLRWLHIGQPTARGGIGGELGVP